MRTRRCAPARSAAPFIRAKSEVWTISLTFRVSVLNTCLPNRGADTVKPIDKEAWMRCDPSLNKLAVIAAALVLGGCGGMPKNAEEFRQFTLERTRVLGAMSVAKETFEVERPFREVSSTLQKKANECLKVVVRRTGTDKYGYTRS